MPIASASGIATWPLVWYWRHELVQWRRFDQNNVPPLVIDDVTRLDAVEAALGNAFSYEEVPVRFWWFPEEEAPSAGEALRYLL